MFFILKSLELRLEPSINQNPTESIDVNDPQSVDSLVSSLRARRRQSAMRYLFAGDALSMPVHWFYRASDILKAFPPMGIVKMEAAPEVHPGSIMSLHSTQHGGRSATGRSTKGRTLGNSIQGHGASGVPVIEVVGDVILKGKADYWNNTGVHYHQGLPAGQNTLNAWCARLMLNWIANRERYQVDDWLQCYIDFMTAEPARHPDTYAESYHRTFFANWANGVNPRQCGGVTHDTPSMGALVTVAPLALTLLKDASLSEVQAICREHVWCTHPDALLMNVVDAYVALMNELMDRQVDLQAETADDSHRVPNTELCELFIEAAAVVPGGNIRRAVDRNHSPSEVVGGQYSLACYIQDSWPSVCFLAARFHNDPEKALKINTNLGGENAHRGAVLGTLLGLVGGSTESALFNQLVDSKVLGEEITCWSVRQ